MALENKAKVLQEAEKYVRQGKTASAIAEYLKVIKSDPADVLTLNTVGDLYLRQGKVQEATKYFAQVAESYARNNFLLKAIAVYRKILSADPESLEINGVVAALYAKQGLTVEARNQYLRVAELSFRDGKQRESREAYEKVAELDPANSAVAIKLGEIHLAEGSHERAHGYFVAAARAQAKAGDLKSAVATYARTLERNALDVEATRGFLQASIQLGDVSGVIQHLERSCQLGADEVVTRQMLGQAYLAAGQTVEAAQTFESILNLDGMQYENFFAVSKAFLDKEDFDRAAASVETILPILISRRETERGVEMIREILKSSPQHLPSLTLLVKAYGAVNDVARQVDALEHVVTYHLNRQKAAEALSYVEQILVVAPGSERHLRMHRQAFQEAFPDTPYRAPAIGQARAAAAADLDGGGPVAADGIEEGLVEVDLNLNYGMRDRALAMLLAMEAHDPDNRDVRKRLLGIYRQTDQPVKAAEQALALATSFRAARNEEEALKYAAEARSLAPELVGPEFAERPEAAAGSEAHADESASLEIDLTGDLSEIFFKDAEKEPREESEEPSVSTADTVVEEFSGQIPQRSGAEIEEQLQEVDFYIRLGFSDEARSKLDEMAAQFPDHAEIASRYRKLGEMAPKEPATPIALGPGGDDSAAASGNVFEPVGLDAAFDRLGSGAGDAPAGTAAPPQAPPRAQPAVDGGPNTLFADIIAELNSDAATSREAFDTHFNLGIAYREMGLFDDAVREFQEAVANLNQTVFPREFIQCCGMLSTCFLEKGMPRSVIRWCQSGLSVPDLSRHEVMALRYDLGVAHSLTGEPDRALECFESIFNLEPSYRDVAARIDELKRRP